MTASTTAAGTAPLTLTGRIIEVGNLDGGNVPGFVIDRGNLAYATITGLTEDEARTVAWHYDKSITISLAPHVAAMPVAKTAMPTPWQQRMHPDGYYLEGTDLRTGYAGVIAARDAEIAELRAALQQRQTLAHAADPIVEANRQLLLDRSRVGVSKYGTTLAGAGLSGRQLLQHALEEALDLSNYLQTLLQSQQAEVTRPPNDWRERAAMACNAERVEEVSPEDVAYNTAVKNCMGVIRQLDEQAVAGAAVATMICPQCGADRLKSPCPGMADECAMIADAHLLVSPSAHPVSTSAGETEVPCWSDEVPCRKCGQVGWHVCRAAHPSAEGGEAEAVLDKIRIRQAFLNWNREQDDMPVEVGREYFVIEKVLELIALPTTQQETDK